MNQTPSSPQSGNSRQSAEEKKKILKARATALAREPEKTRTAVCLEVIEFGLAKERYALETSYVREVYPFKELTPLPCTPPFVLGIVNVRGRILSVIDIRKFFDLPETGITDLHKIIVVHTDETEAGILADVVLGVQAIPRTELQPSLPTLTGIQELYLKGVTADRLLVLNVGKILSDEKIVVHEEVEA
jgi:purine-binding chemotaxis protein CheW